MIRPPLKKILHIDDDAIIRMMVKKALERSPAGLDVVSCASSQEFLDALASFAPDMLLIDVMMPPLNGIDFLRELRKDYPTIPAIFMTGQEDMHLDNRDGLDPLLGIIKKPFSPINLPADLLGLWENA